mmetsp:Transcript_9029/g.30108  ORF Transcript_9029/g.30108 Transcript_9029/m.30108 type:complete len:905 (-) Transcript_9029:93-2807(-)
MWWALALEFVLIGILCWIALNRLASHRVPWHVMTSVWGSYFLVLSLVALVPIDVHLVYVQRCMNLQVSQDDLRECDTGYFMSWKLLYPDISDEDSLRISTDVLKFLWSAVYTGCAFNGWILLTTQQHFVEAQHFSLLLRARQAVYNQGCFFMTVAAILSALFVILVISGENWRYIFQGLMGVGNSLMLMVVALLLGYGLAEFPISLWQEARINPSLKRFRSDAFLQYVKFNRVARLLAKKLTVLYNLRRLASTSLRNLAPAILKIIDESPIDVADALKMDPVYGPSFPVTEEDKEAAFLLLLEQVERERTYGQAMTEIDLWIESLSSANLLPFGTDILSLQDTLYDAKFRVLADVDYLDIARMRKNTEEAAGEDRIAIIKKSLAPLLELEGEVLQMLAEAIVKRNDAKIEMDKRFDEDDFMETESQETNLNQTAAWSTERLVAFKTELHHLNKRYRRAKRKFDLAVVSAILLEDVVATYQALLPWKAMQHTLWNAFLEKEEEDAWRGVESPVKKSFQGRWARRLEVLWFLNNMFVVRFVKVVSSLLCGFLSICMLWSELSVAPWIRDYFSEPQQGSLLLHQVCWASKLPPSCRSSDSTPTPQDPFSIEPSVQVIIICHLLYFMRICHFSLTRLRLWKLYEVIPGETDSHSLLVNAFLACRIVPSITQNYLNMLREAHEEREVGGEATVFEKTFSAMGRVPFVGSSFDEVLPPIMLGFFILNLFFIISRQVFGKRFELFAILDGESKSFTEEQEKEAIILIGEERRRYERISNLANTQRRSGSAVKKKTTFEAANKTLSNVAGKWQDMKKLLPQGGFSDQFPLSRALPYEKSRATTQDLEAGPYPQATSIFSMKFNQSDKIGKASDQFVRFVKSMKVKARSVTESVRGYLSRLNTRAGYSVQIVG